MHLIRVRNRSAYIRITGVLFLVFAASGLTAPLYSNYIAFLGADNAQIGLVFAVFQAASLASQYWWGRRSDRLGRRKPLVLVGTAGLTLAFLGSSIAPRYELLYVTRIIEGLAFAAYSTGSLALIGDLLEDQQDRGRFMGAYRMMGSLAFAGAALTGSWIADQFGLRIPLVLSAACFALGCLLVGTIREEGDGGTAVQPAAESGESGGTDWRTLAPFLGLTFAWFTGMGSVVSFWPVFMKDSGYSQTQIGGLWALAAAGEVFWLFVAGLLADRIGPKWVIVSGVAGMALIYASYTIAPAFAWFIPIQMLRSFTYSCYETPALLYATSLGLRRQRGRLAGLYYTASGIGGIVGSAIGGAAANAFGLVPMFRGTAVLMVLVAIAAAVVMPGRIAAHSEAPAVAKPAHEPAKQ